MYTCMLIRTGIFYKHKYSDLNKPARTYQYIMHTNILKDASEKRATGQTVPGMLRAYKFVNMQTQMLHMYTQTCTQAADCSQYGPSLCPLLINVLQVG